jgi:hypothetical protein
MMASAAGSRPYGIANVVAQAATQFFDDKRVNFWNSIQQSNTHNLSQCPEFMQSVTNR